MIWPPVNIRSPRNPWAATPKASCSIQNAIRWRGSIDTFDHFRLAHTTAQTTNDQRQRTSVLPQTLHLNVCAHTIGAYKQQQQWHQPRRAASSSTSRGNREHQLLRIRFFAHTSVGAWACGAHHAHVSTQGIPPCRGAGTLVSAVAHTMRIPIQATSCLLYTSPSPRDS